MKNSAVAIVLMMAISMLASAESGRVRLSGGSTRDGGGWVREGVGSRPSSSSGDEMVQRNDVRYPEGTTTDNHHNIPRESFGDWGGDGANSNKNGSG
ncbi:hypothetical protein SAY87_027524 [Trapa incisa]|uniref:Uncharacterized protein n=1 Tax=Trapa incisa TaxID=236973 RepID=A0AAN7JMK7_9MYRT|nr:hypothetical protein SAY87_027524 [Trapa incisa]